MKCTKCGYDNPQGARFCGRCGLDLMVNRSEGGKRKETTKNSRKNDTESTNPEKKKGKKITILLLIVCILVAAAIAAYLSVMSQPEKRYERALKTAEKYMEEENYDQAIASYKQAISIDPKQVEPYRQLAKAYIATEDTDAAEETYDTITGIIIQEYKDTGAVLDGAKDVYKDTIDHYGETGDTEKIKEEADEVIEILDDENDRNEVEQLRDFYLMNWGYYNKLQELEKTQGEADVSSEADDLGTYTFCSGLCFAKLVDFNNDGQEELVVAYQMSDGSKYVKEVYGYKDEEVHKLLFGDGFVMFGIHDRVKISILSKDDQSYLIDGEIADLYENDIIYGYQNDSFEKVKTITATGFNAVYSVDDRTVSESTYTSACEEWLDSDKIENYVLADYSTETVTTSIEELNNVYQTLRERLNIQEDASDTEEFISDLATVHSEGSMTSIIDANGNLIMCGINKSGQLGETTPENKTTYTLVSTDIQYVCGTANLAVITKDDELYFKKYDGNKALPNKANVDLELYKVADNVVDAEVWGDVCAYVTDDGGLYGMGSPRGTFGDSKNTKWSDEPIKIMDNIRDIELSTNYDYGTTFAAITKENELYMWGNNATGIIKDSLEDVVSEPMSIMENVKMVSLGRDYVLVLTMDNIVYAWGNNKNGQLGIGNTDATDEVVKVMENVVYVDAGTSSSLAITKDDKLYTWGSNNYGCAGVGTDYGEDEAVETPVAIMDSVRAASIDGETMIILNDDGNVYTCGWNSEGQLGTGDFNDSNVPINVYNIYESDLPGTLSDENGNIVDETYFDTMDDTEISFEGSGQNLIVNMTVDHLSDFVKYNGGKIKLQLSDGNIALMFNYEIEDDVAKADKCVYILVQNNGNFTWMGGEYYLNSCEQNEDTLSWNVTLPAGSFSTESIKYIGANIFTSRNRSHVSTYEVKNGELFPSDVSIEQMDVAVNSEEGYHKYIE